MLKSRTRVNSDHFETCLTMKDHEHLHSEARKRKERRTLSKTETRLTRTNKENITMTARGAGGTLNVTDPAHRDGCICNHSKKSSLRHTVITVASRTAYRIDTLLRGHAKAGPELTQDILTNVLSSIQMSPVLDAVTTSGTKETEYPKRKTQWSTEHRSVSSI